MEITEYGYNEMPVVELNDKDSSEVNRITTVRSRLQGSENQGGLKFE